MSSVSFTLEPCSSSGGEAANTDGNRREAANTDGNRREAGAAATSHTDP
jgi:hypothetical protein